MAGCEYYDCRCEKYIEANTDQLIQIQPIKIKKSFSRGGNLRLSNFRIQDCGVDGRPIIIRRKKLTEDNKNRHDY